ncbi:MAG: glycosyltransferase family 2 protein [Planctomycetota bacterium]
MNETGPDVSVVIPFFNEEDNVPPLIAEILPRLEALDASWELVLVDDGSRDATRERLLAARTEHGPRLRVVAMKRNSGQSAAFVAGFQAARGAVVITMDGDLQIDPDDIGPMLETLRSSGADMVYGWRRNRRDGFMKRLSTKIANGVRNRLTGESIRDTGCPLKVMKREVVASFLPFNGMHRFFITLAHLEGFRTVEMPVNHRPREHGQSKYGVMNRVFRAWRDCLAIRWLQQRRIDPSADEI